MLAANTVSIRDILRNHKKVLERVKSTKKRIILVSQDKPQAGIVSLDDLKKLEEMDKQAQYQSSTKSLLDTAKKIRGILQNKDIPNDLSLKHDHYHYEKAGNE